MLPPERLSITWSRIIPILTAFLLSFSAFPSGATATATSITRSLTDRPDDIQGFQVHLVYVVPMASEDSRLDTNGQIDNWVKEGNTWLQSKVGKSLRFDTYQGVLDVTFLQSKKTVNELCNKGCETLLTLRKEFLDQNPNFEATKTLLFMVGQELDSRSCGWATYASNLALAHDFLNPEGGCNWPNSKAKSGLSGPAGTIIHELIHTFGVHHVCADKSDLMIGTPECTIDDNTYGEIPVTLDLKASAYAGSDSAFGTDILKLPIWTDGTGTQSYATISQTSNLKYIPQLTDDTVYAVVGQVSKRFDWEWQKEINLKSAEISCTFTSGNLKMVGQVVDSACTFHVPGSLRAGNDFTVIQSWKMGPWQGSASVTGKLTRPDLSYIPCTKSICFVGGSTLMPSSCWSSGVKNLVLQQLVAGKWKEISNLKAGRDKACKDKEFPISVNYRMAFKTTGSHIYRWFSPKRPGWNAGYGTPFAIVVNNSNEPEPSQSEVDKAQAQALAAAKLR